jgi:hypothetical protein
MLSVQVKPLLRLAVESPELVLDAPDRGVALAGTDGSVLACSAVLAAVSPWLRRSLLLASCSLLNEQCLFLMFQLIVRRIRDAFH